MAAFDARMPGFRPTRASPPARRARNTQKSPTDLSIRSEQQLKDLTAEEVDFLDAVFDRAGPTAVGFMSVFDAYNYVLTERGLAQDEVVGYAKLLKVGNWRGETWREKWNEVKNKFGYGTTDAGHSKPSRYPVRNLLAFPTANGERTKTIPTVSQYYRASEDDEAEINVPQYHNTPKPPRRVRSPCPSETNTTDPIDVNPLLHPRTRVRDLDTLSALMTSEVATLMSEDGGASSVTPPSYKTTEKEVLPIQTHHPGPTLSNRGISIKPKAMDATAARRVVAAARERKGSVVNENEAWKKIQMERDEREALYFYHDRLLERCWEIWKNGYDWIIVTSKQIDEARDNLLLRITLQRWRKSLMSHQLQRERTAKLLSRRHLKRFFDLWTNKLKVKRQEKWRLDMRIKMKAVRDKHDARVQGNMWAKWRHLYRLRLAAHSYDQHLSVAFFRRWQKKLEHIDRLDMLADEAAQHGMKRLIIQVWGKWKRALEFSLSEKAFVEQICLKTMKNAILTWRKRTRDFQVAKLFHDFILTKNYLNSWKAARNRLLRMNDKATKQMARRDGLLIHAILRIWKAQERGKLLERVTNLRYLRDSLTIWQRRLHEHKQNEGRAVKFLMRPRSSVLVVAIRTWQQNLVTHQNAHAYAVQYHSTQVLDHVLLRWRIALRERLKAAKLARIADKFFAIRRAWRVWRFQLEKRRREALLNVFQISQLRKWFLEWVQRAQKAQARRVSEQDVKALVAKRLVRNSLARWTTAVIDIKLRELEISQQYNLSVQATAFKKWKVTCMRHAEELSLLESYQYVKREECLRKFLHRWLAATRVTRRRRFTLGEKEEEISSMFLIKAWDKWRERFVEEKLRTMEREVVSQNRKNLLFRTFGVWHSKTKPLPALRFQATHLKAKYFVVWRSALPGALQAKKAREAYQEAILSRSMKKWTEMYRAKMATKAIARAKYLRLPTAMPRTNGTRPAQTGVAGSGIVLQRCNRAESPDYESAPSISAFLAKTNCYKDDVAGLLRTKKRIDVRPSRSSISPPHLREVSPAPSLASTAARSGYDGPSKASSTGGKDEEKRSKLWNELREVRRKGRLIWPER
ncbi:hypothetical protein AX15_003966 [Amanita polypyramis BW_CC]|nr:hypothetical protein AX15_003966 [Amanita polypyramis BW_CC]